MTESTEQVKLKLPELKKGPAPESDMRATARIQHIFNDIAKEQHPEKPPPFRESGEFGDKTEAYVIKFQQDNHIPPPADGVVRHLTWAKLLERWAALPTHTLPKPPPPPPPVE
jgi:peptidoglycan hydrolase-like protein with peptidoglycan-binding domain